MELDRATVYQCPSCEGTLTETGAGLRCSRCDLIYPTEMGFTDFLHDQGEGPDTPLERYFFEIIPPIYDSLYFPVLYRLGSLPHFDSPDDHAEELVERTRTQEGTVLDVACGTGLLSRKLAGVNRRVFGLDRSSGMLKQALNNRPESLDQCLDYSRGDAYSLPFQDSYFHAVTCTGALYLFPDLEPVFREIKRVLKPGGYFVGMTVVKQGILGSSLTDFVLNQYQKIGSYRVLDPGVFKQKLLESGFQEFQRQHYGCIMLFDASWS